MVRPATRRCNPKTTGCRCLTRQLMRGLLPATRRIARTATLHTTAPTRFLAEQKPCVLPAHSLDLIAPRRVKTKRSASASRKAWETGIRPDSPSVVVLVQAPESDKGPGVFPRGATGLSRPTAPSQQRA